MKEYTVVLSVDESEVLKTYCQQEGIKFFRTEYWDKRYCKLEVTDEEHDEVQRFLDDLEFVVNDSNNLIAIFYHGDGNYSVVDCINDTSVAGSFYDIVEELSNLSTDVWIDGWFKQKIKERREVEN